MKTLKCFTWLFIVQFLSMQVLMLRPAKAATDSGLLLPGEISVSGKGDEYVSGNTPGAVLMKVNLWGAVRKPGIHHVPVYTDLLTLLSYAGGPNETAELDSIKIKRRAKGKEELIKVDVDDIIYSKGVPSPSLEANDIIVVKENKPVISQNTLMLVGFTGSVLSIILAGFLLNDRVQTK